MKDAGRLPEWAPRLKPYLIRRLYENDASGLLDEELLDQVGWGLYSRCTSFIQAMEAGQGRIHCPVCEAIVLHSGRAKEILHCDSCGWECAWKDYRATISNQQLNGGPEVVALFQEYINRFPLARKPAERMFLIDCLIHGFHHFVKSGRTRRPVAVNLIVGDLSFVIAFLDQLTYGPKNSPGIQKNLLVWREKLESQRKEK